MFIFLYVRFALLATCLALPPARSTPSTSRNNILPEGVANRTIQLAPGGGLADFPEIVDETNLANPPANLQAIQANEVANNLAAMDVAWDLFLDPTMNLPDSFDLDSNEELSEMSHRINTIVANTLAGAHPPAILIPNQLQQQQQQPAVFASENGDPDPTDILNTSLGDLVQVDFSEDPGSTGLGNMDDLYSDGSQPFITHPMVKRDLVAEESDREALVIHEPPQQTIFKRDEDDVKVNVKIITLDQWEFWFDALQKTVFEPLFESIHNATDLGLDLEQAAYQAGRISKGAVNPNAFLRLVFYKMYDNIKEFALKSTVEEMAKEMLSYQEPVSDMIEVNDSVIQTFLKDNTDSSLAFSAAAANIAGNPRGIQFTTNSEATSFENWAKDPKNRYQRLVELVADLSKALGSMFSAFTTLQNTYGFLGAQYEDVSFGAMDVEGNQYSVVENPPVITTVQFDSTSGLDPEGDMFKSRQLPKVRPPVGGSSYSGIQL
ncbi:hypothetical protein TWF281_011002 [Arthrobotrys megalospora]